MYIFLHICRFFYNNIFAKHNFIFSFFMILSYDYRQIIAILFVIFSLLYIFFFVQTITCIYENEKRDYC